MRASSRNIKGIIDLSRKLLFCADRGDIQRTDDSCGVLFGMTRDCAYKMLGMALKERELHIRNGTWEMDEEEQKAENGSPIDEGAGT
jgi:hypothetical protein